VLTAAIREFMEETGFPVHPPFIPLGFIVQKSGKVVHAWAFESDADPARAKSNTFTMEWPPHSGRMREFPEIDRVVFFTVEQALDKIKPAQADLITRLAAIVASRRRWARPNLAPGAGPQPRLSATGGQYP
jgi:predicted NUDIX family NTP pyrophosphohydrolase